MGTQRASWTSSAPTTEFILEGDLVETNPSYGTYGGWKLRLYLRAVNRGNTSSFSNDYGRHAGRVQGVEFGAHAATPFLPSGYATGAQRWNEGPFDVWVPANANGYVSGTSLSVPLEQHVAFSAGSNVSYGSITVGRIASAPGAPGAPTFYSVTPTGMTVFWSDASPGSSPVTTYQVQRSLSSGMSSPTTVTTGTSTFLSVSGLTPNTTYYYRVRAQNNVGWGSWSSIRSQATTASPPGQVLGVSAGSPTINTIPIVWSAPDPGGSAIVGYDVQHSTSSNFSSPTTLYPSGTGTSYTIPSLSPATLYFIRVRARNASGAGAWSVAATATTLPAEPLSLAASSTSFNSADLSWVDPGNGSQLDDYEIQHSLSPSFTSPTTVSGVTGTSRSVSGLAPGSTHYFRIRARDGAIYSAWSNVASATTQSAPPPGITVAPALMGTSATVTVSVPAGITPTSYTIEYRIGSGAATSVAVSQATSVIPGLTPGTTYEWRASWTISGSASPWSNWVSATQPKPSTNPGDYFDGSFGQDGDTLYAWTGAPHASTTTASNPGVLNWAGGAPAGGVVLYRIGAGLFGSYAARVDVGAIDIISGMWVRVGTNAPDMAAVASGGYYSGSIYVQPSHAQRLRLTVEWRDAVGSLLSTSHGAEVVVPGGTWTRLLAAGTSPAGASLASLYVTDVSGAGFEPWVGGDSLLLDGAMLTFGDLYTYFDGDTPDTSAFQYGWRGTPNESESERITLDAVFVDPLVDPDCDPVPVAPRPPAIDVSCIAPIASWRRYWISIPAYEIGAWTDSVPTLNLTPRTVAAEQVRIRFYPNPAGGGPDTFDASEWEAEMILSYAPAGYTVVINGLAQLATASNGGESIPADHLLYGTGGRPPTWPILTCGVPYLISLDVPSTSPDNDMDVDFFITERIR